ncbi:hypothetical protein ACHAWF_003553 [Thalassiosira exigua]
MIASVFGYSDELRARYGSNRVHRIWREFVDVFASLPLAVRTDTAAIMHGGLPSADFNLQQIACISPEERFKFKTVMEPRPDKTLALLQGILWSDPQPEAGISANDDRGCGMRFGPDIVRQFLADHGLMHLIRSHEVVDAGYELLECDDGMSAVTVFSAAKYPNGMGFNNGAIVRLHCDKGGHVTFDSYSNTHAEGSDRKMKQKQMSHGQFADLVVAHRVELEEEFEYLAAKRARRIELQQSFKCSPVTPSKRPRSIASEPNTLFITREQLAHGIKTVLNSELPYDWLDSQRFIAPGSCDLVDYKKFLQICSNSSSDKVMRLQ